jgi:O-antigen/teichoic acid export membrane protein
LHSENDAGLLQTVFASSVKYTSVLLVPATFVLMILSTPMVNTIFGYLPSGDPKYALHRFILLFLLPLTFLRWLATSAWETCWRV